MLRNNEDTIKEIAVAEETTKTTITSCKKEE